MPSLYAYRRKTRSVLQRPTMARDPNSCAAVVTNPVTTGNAKDPLSGHSTWWR